MCLGVSGERVSVCGGFGTIWVCLAVCVCYDGYSAASGVSMGSLAMWVARLATSGVKFRCEGRGLGGGWRAGSTIFPLPAPISISTICLSKPIHFSVCFTLTFLFFFLFIFSSQSGMCSVYTYRHMTHATIWLLSCGIVVVLCKCTS